MSYIVNTFDEVDEYLHTHVDIPDGVRQRVIDAAAGTITGQWAARNGYTTVVDVVAEPSSAAPGAYTKVTAKFRK